MTRKAIIGILALPALVVLFLAMSWIDGAVVRARLARLDKTVGTTVPLFVVTGRKETSGLFGSTVEVTYELDNKLFKGMAAAAVKQTAYAPGTSVELVAGPTPSFTLRHHIQHGPIPGFATLGLARIDTEFVMPESARQELRKNIGTDQPLKIITLLGYLGGGSTSIDSPAYTYNDPKGKGTIDWRGLKGRLNFTRHMNSNDGNMTMLGMKVKDEKGGEVEVGPMSFDYNLTRAFKYLFVGKAGLTMQRMAVALPQQASPVNMEMRDVAYEVDSTANGEYVDTTAKIGLGSISAGALKSVSLHYDFSLRHLHGPTYAELADKMRGIYSASLADNKQALEQIVGSLKEYGALLLEHQPELTIERIAMAFPEGGAQLSGKVSIPGYAHGDLDSGPMVLLPKIEASVDVTLDEGFLNRDWDPPSPSANMPAVAAPGSKTHGAKGAAAQEPAPLSRLEMMKAQLAAMEQQGYVTRNGSRLSSHLEFKHGALTVNGKPMGPPSAGR